MQKGELIGYTIGKYGVELFAGSATVKGLTAYRKLRAANRICNLEAMSISQANKEVTIASALKHLSQREGYFKKIKYNFNAHNKHLANHSYYDGRRSIWQHKDPEGLLSRKDNL